MENKGNFLRFIHSPCASTTMWSMDPVTEDVITRCESCNAEARHSKYELEQGFSFRHNAGCASGGDWPLVELANKSRHERALELAARLGNVLEQETDADLLVAVVTAVSVM